MNTAEKLIAILTRKNLICATAESCTGGGVGFAITSISGASAVYWGGVVSYDNSVKRDVLGVSEKILNTKGAVSSECALAMAQGVRQKIGTDLAVSITGIAGPGGGSTEKPVGLVWFGVSTKLTSKTEKKIFSGDRDAIRASAIEYALQLLIEAAEKISNSEFTSK